jgi:hypothetical protein
MLFREIIGIYSKNHVKYINILYQCGENAVIINVKDITQQPMFFKKSYISDTRFFTVGHVKCVDLFAFHGGYKTSLRNLA